MTIGLIGRKLGMTRVFSPDGKSYGVTVIEVLGNQITQLKTAENDGYSAIQVSTGTRRAHKVSKPMAGHYAKAGSSAGRLLREFRLSESEQAEKTYEVGSVLTLDLLKEGQLVDVQGITKGRGFAGTVKRHHFRTQDATHGNSLSHRVPGSIGQNQSPGRVFKGKKMCGQMGNATRTLQNLKVIKIDMERQVVLIYGAIPGAPGGEVVLRPAVKASRSI
jgi:large subunit ribosomal protein L3